MPPNEGHAGVRVAPKECLAGVQLVSVEGVGSSAGSHKWTVWSEGRLLACSSTTSSHVESITYPDWDSGRTSCSMNRHGTRRALE